MRSLRLRTAMSPRVVRCGTDRAVGRDAPCFAPDGLPWQASAVARLIAISPATTLAARFQRSNDPLLGSRQEGESIPIVDGVILGDAVVDAGERPGCQQRITS